MTRNKSLCEKYKSFLTELRKNSSRQLLSTSENNLNESFLINNLINFTFDHKDNRRLFFLTFEREHSNDYISKKNKGST